MAQLFYEFAIIAAIGAAAANTLHIWLGSPNPDTGEYWDGMIFSKLGGELLAKYMATRHWPISPFKIPLCQYCLSVWLCWGAGLLLGAKPLTFVFAPLLTAVFVTFFLNIDKHGNQ